MTYTQKQETKKLIGELNEMECLMEKVGNFLFKEMEQVKDATKGTKLNDQAFNLSRCLAKVRKINYKLEEMIKEK